jgi:hypothetical protein
MMQFHPGYFSIHVVLENPSAAWPPSNDENPYRWIAITRDGANGQMKAIENSRQPMRRTIRRSSGENFSAMSQRIPIPAYNTSKVEAEKALHISQCLCP